MKVTTYQQKVANYYNKKVRHKTFMRGDLDLKKIMINTKKVGAKVLVPNQEGPNIIVCALCPKTYQLEDLNEKLLCHLQNVKHLRKYYQ